MSDDAVELLHQVQSMTSTKSEMTNEVLDIIEDELENH